MWEDVPGRAVKFQVMMARLDWFRSCKVSYIMTGCLLVSKLERKE